MNIGIGSSLLTVLSFVLFITLSLLLIYVLKLKNSRSGAPDSIDKEVEERTENLNMPCKSTRKKR